MIGGAFAGNPSEALYRLIIANGVLEDVDAISFHSYSSYAEDEDRMIQMRESQIAKLREIEASSGSSGNFVPPRSVQPAEMLHSVIFTECSAPSMA